MREAGTTVETDVLVIGLGPAGASAAAAASRAGVRVLALDRRRQPGVPVQCAELVPGLIGQDVDVHPSALAQSIRRMRTFVEAGSPDVKAPFPGYMLDRLVFDRLLVDSARSAGAECCNRAAIRCLGRDGAALTQSGTRIRARAIIGADGPLSLTGRTVGRRNPSLVYARQVTVPLAVPQDATDIFLSARVRGGYGWLFPKGAQAHVGIGVMASDRIRLKSLLSDLLLRLQREGRIGAGRADETGGAIPAGGMLEPCAHYAGRPVLLAGDAAGLANPVTGAGIHAALVSGRLAGAAAAAWIAGDAGALADYADELREVFGASLQRALARRRALLMRFRDGGAPGTEALRNGWIAFPGYWQAPLWPTPEPAEAVA